MFERGSDQAQGLRQLFADRTVHLVPVLANPHAAGAARLLDGLCQAFAAQGQRTLVVDAAVPARAPAALAAALAAGHGLQDWAEAIDAHTALLPVGGALPSFAAAPETAQAVLQALAGAGSVADVILVHADALLLSGLFAQRPVCPLVLSGDSAESITHTYAGLKLLVRHGGLRRHALLMDLAAPASGQAQPMAASRLQQCAAEFLRARLESAAVVCSSADGDRQLAQALRPVALGLLPLALPLRLAEAGPGPGAAAPAGLALHP